MMEMIAQLRSTFDKKWSETQIEKYNLFLTDL